MILFSMHHQCDAIPNPNRQLHSLAQVLDYQYLSGWGFTDHSIDMAIPPNSSRVIDSFVVAFFFHALC